MSRPDADPSEDEGRDSARALARHSTVYAVAPVAQRLLALLLVRFYTAELSTAEWGILSLTDLFLGLLPILVGTSLLAGMSRFYFLRQDAEERSAVVSTVFLGVVLSSAAIAGLGFLARDSIASALFSGAGGSPSGASPPGDGTPLDYVRLVTLCLAVFPLSMATAAGIQALQIQKRSRAVVRITIAKSLLEAGLKLWFLLGLGRGVEGFLLAILVGEALAALGLGAWVLRSFGARFSRRLMAPLLRYSGPIVPVALFQLGLHQSDKLLLERLGPRGAVDPFGGRGETEGLALLGVYALGYQIPFLLHVTLSGSFQKIWQPNAFGSRRQDSAGVGNTVVLLLGAFYAAASLFAAEGVRVLTARTDYHAADGVVPWVAAAYLGYGAYALAQTALMTHMRTRSLAVLNGAALALNVALNFALIPRFGIHGAAAATLVSFWALSLASARAAAACGTLPFDPRRLAAALGWVVAAALAGGWIDTRYEPFGGNSLAAKALVVGLLLAVVHRTLRGDGRLAPGIWQRFRTR